MTHPQTLWLSDETSRLIEQGRSLVEGEREKTQVVRDALREYIAANGGEFSDDE